MAEVPERGRRSGGAEQPQISGYRLEGVLGRGASGVVYRARQLSVDRPVALKVLHLSATAKESTVKRLRREARLMAKLDHPNIVTAVDVGKSEGGWWLAMELVEGRALSERLHRGGPLDESEAIELFIPLCHALQHAHEAGVIHRDVKPANILLSITGEPKLVDLGLARTEDEVQFTRLGATLGTPHYVSAEQARNPVSVDARSDVYSLAATIHHAVCGAPPFSGESPAEVLANVLRAPLRRPREVNASVSKGMDLVLRKALSRDPARRHASARELANDLRLIASGKRPRVQLGQLEALEGAGGVKRAVFIGAAALGLLTLLFVIKGAGEPEAPAVVVEAQSALEVLRAEWVSDELTLAEALRMHALMAPLDSERESHVAFGVELQRELESLLFKLRSEADEARTTLIRERRFDEAHQVFQAGFVGGLFDASGLAFEDLPRGRLDVMQRWRDRTESEIVTAEERLHEESAQSLKRWCEGELWPRAAERVRRGSFDEAAEMLDLDLFAQLESAGVEPGGIELKQLAQSAAFTEAQAQHSERRYQVEEAWRELDERLLGLVKSECASADARLRAGEVAEISHEVRRWAERRFSESGLDKNAMPARFASRAGAELERSVMEMEGFESRIAEEREYELMESLEESSRALVLERRYSELLDWWSEQKRGASEGLLDLIDLKIGEARLLADFLEEARAAVIRGVKGEVTLQEGGHSIESAVRLDGDPVFDGFWVSIAPGSERSWRLGGSPEADGGVKRVSRASLEQLAGRSHASLAVAFLRLNEGDYFGADECFSALDLRDAATRLGDELSARIGPLLAAELETSSERGAWAVRWIECNITERSSEVSTSKALRRVKSFLRDYADSLNEKQRAKVLDWRDQLERASVPSTLDEFKASYEADALSFPRRGRVELTQRFDEEREGVWSAGDWAAIGSGWKAPRRAGVEEMLESGAPTLILRDPVTIDRGAVEVEFELSVPSDARARIVVVSATGFHVAFLTGDEASGRLLAGSRDLNAVVERALTGAGDEFQGFFPGETYRVSMQANSARGSLKVFIDGEECARLEDLSPKGGARSTSVSVRSLEPLLLVSAKIVAGRR
jgi:hypothetical protein